MGAIPTKGGEQHGEASEEKSRLGCCSAQGVGHASREDSQVQTDQKAGRVIVPDLRAREHVRAAGSNLAPRTSKQTKGKNYVSENPKWKSDHHHSDVG